jgi:hypothetical protein
LLYDNYLITPSKSRQPETVATLAKSRQTKLLSLWVNPLQQSAEVVESTNNLEDGILQTRDG